MIADSVHLVADPSDRFEVRHHTGTTTLYVISARGQATLTMTAEQRSCIAGLLAAPPAPLRAVSGGE